MKHGAPIGAVASVGHKIMEATKQIVKTVPKQATKKKSKLFVFKDISTLDGWDQHLPKQAKTILLNLPKYGVKYGSEVTEENILSAVNKMDKDGVLLGKKGLPIAQPAMAIFKFYVNWYKGSSAKDTKVTMTEVHK